MQIKGWKQQIFGKKCSFFLFFLGPEDWHRAISTRKCVVRAEEIYTTLPCFTALARALRRSSCPNSRPGACEKTHHITICLRISSISRAFGCERFSLVIFPEFPAFFSQRLWGCCFGPKRGRCFAMDLPSAWLRCAKVSSNRCLWFQGINEFRVVSLRLKYESRWSPSDWEFSFRNAEIYYFLFFFPSETSGCKSGVTLRVSSRVARALLGGGFLEFIWILGICEMGGSEHEI